MTHQTVLLCAVVAQGKSIESLSSSASRAERCSLRAHPKKQSRGAHVPSRQRYLGNLDDEVVLLLSGIALDSDRMAHFQSVSHAQAV